VSVSDWRSESEVRAAKVRISWGKVLATRERACDTTGQPLRFFPASVGEMMSLWTRLGGPAHTVMHNPLVLVRLSQSGLAPLILLSVAALAAMEDRVEIADRLKIAIEIAISWLQNRARGNLSASTCLLVLDAGQPYPILVTHNEEAQHTPPPFHITDPPPGRALEQPERKRQPS
jgi:hypothetical protein